MRQTRRVVLVCQIHLRSFSGLDAIGILQVNMVALDAIRGRGNGHFATLRGEEYPGVDFHWFSSEIYMPWIYHRVILSSGFP